MYSIIAESRDIDTLSEANINAAPNYFILHVEGGGQQAI